MLKKVTAKQNSHITKMQKHLVGLSEVNRMKSLVRQSAECTYYGKVAVDIFTCDRNFLSGVTLPITFGRR